jgi:hypothetical protein
VSRGRHRKPSKPTPARRVAATAAATAVGVGTLAAVAFPASADGFSSGDKVRCIGAVQTPGAFACYTSPHFDNVGLDQTAVADFPVVCFGLGCTGDELVAYAPDQTFAGRFTAVYYLGHTYTVYRPDDAQPYILTSDNPRLDPVTAAEAMALEATLAAADQ